MEMRKRGETELENNLPHRRASVSPRPKWTLTQETFDQLLARLDTDRERAGEKYEEIRHKLVKFFEWEGCPCPEDQADEVINRVARKIDEGAEIHDLYGYCFGVARMLLMEIFREREKQQRAMERLPWSEAAAEEPDEPTPRLECLEQCLRGLPPETRELIMQYYQGEERARIENRRKLAERLMIPVNALRNRALRLRAKLESCVDYCLKRRR